nr:tetratricopeptide repeat-containing diguanylate cyclase [uncultured Devosia sp.]
MARTGRSAEALAQARQVLIEARTVEDEAAVAESYTQIAWLCLQLGYPDEGIDCAIAAKKLWQQLGNAGQHANASAIYSWLLVEMGLVDEGFSEAETAVHLAERQLDQGIMAFALNAKGIALMYCRQDQLAAPLMQKCLDLVADLDVPSEEALYLINLAYSTVSLAEAAEAAGDAEGGLRLRHDANMLNDAAIDTAIRCGDLWNLRTALCNGAEYYGLLGELGRADDYLAQWESVPGEAGLRERIHYLYTSAELLTLQGRLDEALTRSEEAVALAEQNTNADHKASTIRRLSDVHEALGNFEQALALHKQFHIAYQRQMGDVTRRRAQLVEMQLETRKLRAKAARLEEQAAHDALTGLPNRRGLDSAFARLQGSRFCLAIADLDHFKAVNDDFSHLVGDAVLKRIASLLTSFGDQMRAFRLGGEEFALLFPDTDIFTAMAVAETVRRTIAQTDWSDLAPDLRVTTSIGVAVSKGGPMTELMTVADRRLYRAKSFGRNRVIATDLAEELDMPA